MTRRLEQVVTWAAAGWLVLGAVLVQAAVPKTISYQGYLKDGTGKPVTTATSVVFSLYSSNPPRNNRVWSEIRSVTPTNGVYSVSLGTITPLAVPFEVPYFLGVKMAGDPELTPLQPLTGAPYAFRAAAADSLNSAATINLPPNGLTVGTNQLVVSGGNVGIGTATPSEQLEITGNLKLPPTTATTGQLRQNGSTLLHTFGANNFFAGYSAGNLTMTGADNLAIGRSALQGNTTGSKNIAIGVQALVSNETGANNTAIGWQALYWNKGGSNNTATGFQALANNTTGGSNTAYGVSALMYNTTAGGNTAIGTQALFSQSDSGNHAPKDAANTAIGYQTLYSNQTFWFDNPNNSSLSTWAGGTSNTAIGYKALYSNQPVDIYSGTQNTAVGAIALYKNITGRKNTALGESALYNNTTGSNNTAVGQSVLQYNTTGAFNIVLGDYAGWNIVAGISNIYIGEEVAGPGDESNTIRIGTDMQSRTFIKGIRGVTTAGAAVPVVIDGSGQLGTVSSSRRFKEDIADMGSVTNGLMKLRPVTFRYKPEYASGPLQLHYGLIAEEVAEVYPELVQYDSKGEMETVSYNFVNAMLLNEVQKQHRTIESQQERINSLEEKLRAQDERLARLEILLSGIR